MHELKDCISCWQKFLRIFVNIVATVAIRCSVLSLCKFLPRNGIVGLSFVLTSLILAWWVFLYHLHCCTNTSTELRKWWIHHLHLWHVLRVSTKLAAPDYLWLVQFLTSSVGKLPVANPSKPCTFSYLPEQIAYQLSWTWRIWILI